jgi:3-oxoadipate enol-lactonase
VPKVRVNGIEIAYSESGSGFPVLFGHGLTLDSAMFDDAVARLSRTFRTIGINFRCHGESEKVDRPFTLWDVAGDVEALAKHLGIDSCLYVGLSMGGMVGMRLALTRPGLIQGMVLLDTSAGPEPQREQYEQWAEMSRSLQVDEKTARSLLSLMFSRSFYKTRPPIISTLAKQVMKNDPAAIYRATLAVVQREGILDRIGEIRIPALVVVGEEDAPTPPAMAAAIHAAIPGSELFRVPAVGHLSILESPEIVVSKIESFLIRASA